MNWIDIILSAVIGINVFNGSKKGLIRSIFGLVAVVLAAFICIKWTASLSDLLILNGVSEAFSFIIAILVLFFSVYFIVTVFGNSLHEIALASGLKSLNFLLGMLLGFIKGVIISLFIIIPILNNTLAAAALHKTFENSLVLNFGAPLIIFSAPLIEEVFAKNTIRLPQKTREDLDELPAAEEIIPKFIELTTAATEQDKTAEQPSSINNSSHYKRISLDDSLDF
jgi:membrane protein required for colicin V production